MGGTMDNKVVTTIGRALRDNGIPTLRFNFRGVGECRHFRPGHRRPRMRTPLRPGEPPLAR
jgi:alpha/beta superfamily hydrolase